MPIIRALLRNYYAATHTADVEPTEGPATLLSALPVLMSTQGAHLVAGRAVAVQMWSDVGGIVLGPYSALPTDWNCPNDLTVTRDLQVNRNAHVDGTIHADGNIDTDANLIADRKLGVGIVSPARQVHIYGAGQALPAITDDGNVGANIYIQDSGNLLNNGGAITFGAYQGFFAAIKSLIQSGTPNTIGDLAFLTRSAYASTDLAERFRLTWNGRLGVAIAAPEALFHVAGVTQITWGTTNTTALVLIGTRGTTGGSLWVHTASLNATYPSGFGVQGVYASQISNIQLGAYGVASTGGYGSVLSFHTTNGVQVYERARIDQNGYFGIGLTTLAALLDIFGPYGRTTAGPTLFQIAGQTNKAADFSAVVITPTLGTTANNLNIIGMKIAPVWDAYNQPTITSAKALYITATKQSTQAVTVAYALYIDAPTGATNNHAAVFMGGNVAVGNATPTARFEVNNGTTAQAVADFQHNGASLLKIDDADKIGFFGATTVAKQAHIADADGTLADLTTKFNALLAKLEAYGLLAAS
jgi:hypothetical protein